MAHTYTNLLTPIIFSTKDRQPTLEPELKLRLFPYHSVLEEARDQLRREISVGMNATHQNCFLSPLPGLGWFADVVPRLAPWATIWRRSAANATHRLVI
jgi:hypothetical protein